MYNIYVHTHQKDRCCPEYTPKIRLSSPQGPSSHRYPSAQYQYHPLLSHSWGSTRTPITCSPTSHCHSSSTPMPSGRGRWTHLWSTARSRCRHVPEAWEFLRAQESNSQTGTPLVRMRSLMAPARTGRSILRKWCVLAKMLGVGPGGPGEFWETNACPKMLGPGLWRALRSFRLRCRASVRCQTGAVSKRSRGSVFARRQSEQVEFWSRQEFHAHAFLKAFIARTVRQEILRPNF